MASSYLSPAVEARTALHSQQGIFAVRPIRKGEILTFWAGDIYTRPEFMKLPGLLRSRSLQVEEDLFMVPRVEEPADYFNHSCEPNAGLSGQLALIALRDIDADEEVTFDYAMSDGSDYDEFVCRCGRPQCRGRVTGDDWQSEVLQARYRGHFSPYLQRRIDQQNAEQRNHTHDYELLD